MLNTSRITSGRNHFLTKTMQKIVAQFCTWCYFVIEVLRLKEFNNHGQKTGDRKSTGLFSCLSATSITDTSTIYEGCHETFSARFLNCSRFLDISAKTTTSIYMSYYVGLYIDVPRCLKSLCIPHKSPAEILCFWYKASNALVFTSTASRALGKPPARSGIT